MQSMSSRRMNTKYLKRITNDRQHAEALVRFESIFGVPKGHPDFHEYYILGLLIRDFEEKRWTIGSGGPIAAIEFAMDRKSLRPKDLVGIIGSSARVGEVLSGKRRLTLNMIKRFSSK